MIFFVASALAASFYHPSDVADASKAYADASQNAASRAGDAQRQARSLAAALADFEEANDLLGAPPSERHAALTKEYNRQFAVLQAFVDEQIEAFDLAFLASMERALKAHPAAARCLREIPVGTQLPGMRARTQANPDCRGDDLNASLAMAMDKDPELRGVLKQLDDRTWPTLALEPVPQPTSGSRWIAASTFFQGVMPDTLRRIRGIDEDERLAFQVAIEQGASREELEKFVDAAKVIDRKTAALRAEAAAPVLTRAAVVFTKAAPDAGWCAQPAVLGGCVGTDGTAELQALLLADKKLAKVLP